MSHRTTGKTMDAGSIRLWIAVGLMAGTLAGCSTAVIEGSASAVSGQEEQTVAKNQVSRNNDLESGNLHITDLKADFTGNLLRAHVSLLNKDNDTLHFQYRFSWFDESGREIDADTDAWTPLILYGKESRSLQAIAPAPGAKEFMIKIRRLTKE